MKPIKALFDRNFDDFSNHYDMYYSMILGFVYSKVNNYQDAEDICQEIFSRFYDNLEDIREPKKWLLGCLRKVILEFYKKNKTGEIDLETIFNDVGFGYVNGFREARIVINSVLEDVCADDESGDEAIFNLIAINNFSIVDASRHLKLNYKQTHYRYNRICEKILAGLRKKGVKQLEDLL